MNYNKIKKTAFTDFSKKILLLGFGLSCYLLSLIFQSRAGYFRLAINNYFSVMTNFVLGVLNAQSIYEYVHACANDKNNFSVINVFEFVAYVFFSCGFFNVVMIPFSGFGIVEVIIVFIYMIGNIVSKTIKTKKINFSGQDPWSVLLFGIVLMVLKFFTYYFVDDNIYLQFVEGNTVLRFVIFAITLVGAVGIVKSLVRICEANLGGVNVKKGKPKTNFKDAVISFLLFIGAMIKKLVKFILGVFTGWVGVLILLVVFLLAVGIGFFLVDQFFNSVMRLVEPILQKFMTTGEYSVNSGLMYTVCQFSALAIYVMFVFVITNAGKNEIENQCDRLLENFILNDQKFLNCNRESVKKLVIKEVESEKNDLKKIAIASNVNEIEKIAREVIKTKC